jgi:hypothetical protein
MDELCADRELLAALRDLAARDRAVLAAAGPGLHDPAEVARLAAELDVDLGDVADDE